MREAREAIVILVDHNVENLALVFDFFDFDIAQLNPCFSDFEKVSQLSLVVVVALQKINRKLVLFVNVQEHSGHVVKVVDGILLSQESYVDHFLLSNVEELHILTILCVFRSGAAEVEGDVEPLIFLEQAIVIEIFGFVVIPSVVLGH